MTDKLTHDEHTAEYRRLLEHAHDTLTLLQRAVRLGYNITLTPEALSLIVQLLGEATLQKEPKS